MQSTAFFISVIESTEIFFEFMKAPKLRGPFRNVRTEPRTFTFKSRHLPDSRPEWEERKRRVEEEVEGGSDAPRPIKFRQGGRSAEGRAARRAASIRASRMAALRAGGAGGARPPHAHRTRPAAAATG